MNKLLILCLATGTLLTSCTKKTDSPVQRTLLNNTIDAKYIADGGSNLTVNYAAYKPGADCDKSVYKAAVDAVQGGTGINTVTINGTNLQMVFDRASNVQPAKLFLVNGTTLYKASNQSWPWKGYISIRKQNALLTSAQFDNAVAVNIRAVNTGDIAQVLSKNITGDVMTIEYALTQSNPAYSQSVSINIQANTPVTVSSQLEVTCLVPGFVDPQSTITIDIPTQYSTITQQDLGNNTTAYTQQTSPAIAIESLSAFIALQYFTNVVYPIVK